MKQIKLNNLSRQYNLIKKKVDKRIKKVFENNNFILGKEVFTLEKKLIQFTGAKFCLGVSSGTDALLMSLMALKVKTGDEIIVPAFSYISTVEVVVRLGAKPVFVDVEIDTANIDISKISEKITKKTKAIIVVSLFGQTIDFFRLNKILKKSAIPVIEDAAQSFGSSYRNRKSCNLSTIGCTSFFPAKPLACYGDGGAVFTNNRQIYNSLKEIRVHGQIKKNIHNSIGLLARLDTIQAAILLEKLKIFKKEIKNRKRIAEKYNNFMEKNGIQKIEVNKYVSSVYAQYTIKVKNRDRIQKLLKDDGISTAVYYPLPLNYQKPYRKYSSKTPNAKKLSQEVLSIPFDPYLTNNEIEIVCERLLNIIKNN